MIKEIIATIATTLVVGSYIPQIIRGYRTKSLRDVSLGFLLIIAAGIVLWGSYAVLNGDFVFLTTNVITFVFLAVLLAMKMMYDK